MIEFLILSLLTALGASASYEVHFSKHFAGEELNKAAPHYDLTTWGYYGGQLPRVYDMSTNNFTYLPEASHQEFTDVISGKRNSTIEYPEEFKSPTLGQKERRAAFGNTLVFTLRGSTGDDDYLLQPGAPCATGAHSPWLYVVMRHADDAYITFWLYKVCNGAKGSFNPVCGYGELQICSFDNNPFKWNSFALSDGCHRQYASDGCHGGTSP
ncbi:hypothetical protein VF21_04879 [Pseudogymnoascus sp. 05NY08]|nr:hypothetical protein VF21_04879 [Pseudogymnoascus sp. 05NY08]